MYWKCKHSLVITIPLVLFGLFRYWYLVEKGEGEAPTELLYRDLPLVLTVSAWALLSILATRPG